MSALKKNYHCTIKEKTVAPAGLFHGQKYKIAIIQKWSGERKRVYLIIPGQEGFVCLWASQLSALSRCEICDSEQHPTPADDKDGFPKSCPTP